MIRTMALLLTLLADRPRMTDLERAEAEINAAAQLLDLAVERRPEMAEAQRKAWNEAQARAQPFDDMAVPEPPTLTSDEAAWLLVCGGADEDVDDSCNESARGRW